MNYENHTVLLEDGTVGMVSRSSIHHNDIHDFVGEELEVLLHDEDGNPIRKIGRVVEVVEVAYLDDPAKFKS